MTTQMVRLNLDRLKQGDEAAREALFVHASRRLQLLAERMFRDYPRLQRWVAADDVFQQAMLRLDRALRSVQPETPAEFFGLASLQIRRELKDMARHYFGPEGPGPHHASTQQGPEESSAAADPLHGSELTSNPELLAFWAEFHQLVEDMPEKERQTFEMLWYHELNQEEVAEALGVTSRQVRRYWQNARLWMQDRLAGLQSAFG